MKAEGELGPHDATMITDHDRRVKRVTARSTRGSTG